MSNIIPLSRPMISRAELVSKIHQAFPRYEIPPLCFIGIRGYYKRTMGDPSKNDRMIYDDAIFILAPQQFFSFNANTDPSAFREGIANLKKGIWPVYRFDLHKGLYLALCQRAGNVTVLRDKKGEDTGMFGINIHRGGESVTGSLGCQTIPRSQWDQFINEAQRQAALIKPNSWRKEIYTYILLEE